MAEDLPWGDIDGAWLTLEILHQLELRRYEILSARDEETINRLYCELFLDEYEAPSLKLRPEIDQVYFNSPALLMDDRWEAVMDGVQAYRK